MIGKIAGVFPTAFRAAGHTAEKEQLAQSKAEDATVEAETEDAEEARYVERAQIGDPVAIGWLITRYRQRVVRLAARILHRPDDAEDVAQEAFIRAFRHLHAYRGEGRFYTWLYHIVVRLCLDRQRMRWWKAEAPIDFHALRVQSNSPSVEAAIEHHMLVAALLERLSPQMRAMLVLRELEGLEYAEIADVLEIPIGRVKWRLHAARAQFRRIWEEAMQEVENV